MVFKMCININSNGWKMIKIDNKAKLREAIIDALYLEVPTEVIVKYRKDDADRILCSFHNFLADKEKVMNKIDNKFRR